MHTDMSVTGLVPHNNLYRIDSFLEVKDHVPLAMLCCPCEYAFS
jgi:hypothetical protein